MGFRGLKTTVISEGSVTASDSARTRKVKSRFVRFSRRERIWNVRLHARENHLIYALSTLRGDPSHESNNQSMGNQRSTTASQTSKQHRNATNVSSPKAGVVLVEDLKRQNMIRS